MAEFGQVPPTFASHNIGDRAVAYAILPCEFALAVFARRIDSANLLHLFSREFVPVVTFFTRHPAFVSRISKVLCMSAEKHVMGVHAKRIVTTGAVMADLQAIRDSPKGDLVSNPMSIPYMPMPIDKSIATVPVGTGDPYPTSIAATTAVHLGPKVPNGVTGATVVPTDKAHWTTLSVAHAVVGIWGERGGLSTATFAQLGGLNIKGKLSILVHVTDLLSRLVATPRTVTAVAGSFRV